MTFETIHGHSIKRDAPEYRTFIAWQSMLWRCYNKNRKDYPRYGGRGITVYGPWKKDYLAFLADMGLRPDGASLGRIDNERAYGPQNCRWESATQQARNRSNNHRLEHGGKSQTITEWAIELGISKSALQHRLAKGWSISDALSRPAKAQKNSRSTWTSSGTRPRKHVDLAELVDMAKAGAALGEMSAHFNVGKFVIRKRIAEYRMEAH